MQLYLTVGKLTVYEDKSTTPVSYVWHGGMQIDCDGSGGNPDRDPCWQSDTSLHSGGRALNAYKVPFVVVPPEVRRGVPGIVLGCAAQVSYNGKTIDAVVGDIGPSAKAQGERYNVGEASVHAAYLLGIPHHPRHGGVEEGVTYRIFPGQAAEVLDVIYHLVAM